MLSLFLALTCVIYAEQEPPIKLYHDRDIDLCKNKGENRLLLCFVTEGPWFQTFNCHHARAHLCSGEPPPSALPGRKASVPAASTLAPCLVAKFKFQKKIPAPAWRIKSRRNKKHIAQFVCKSRDESNEPN